MTASIGVFLGTIPGVENGSSRKSSFSGRTGTLFGASTITDELLAFEESLKVAIANNELQAAIEQEYLRNDTKEANPAVVIVTETVNKSWNFGTGSENDVDAVSDTVDSSNAAIGMSVRDPGISNASNESIESPVNRNKARLAGIGITGTVLFSVLLVMWLVGGRKRNDDRRTEEVIVDVKEKIRKHHRNRHSKTMKLDESGPIKQKLLTDDDHTFSPHKKLLQLVDITGDNDLLSRNNVVDVEAGADDDDDSQNDFVLGEDDDSEASVGQHLQSASRSSGCRTPQSVDSPTPDIDFFLDETVEETIKSDVPTPGPTVNFEMQGIVATVPNVDTEVESLGESTAEENISPSKTTTDDSDRSKASTHGSDTNDGSASLTNDTSDGRSMAKSVGTSISQKERIQQIRSQVLLLVRDVAPDEERNVDEMIRQFKSREEELLETLLGMKEKIIARKARIESQMIAKRDAKAHNTSNESRTSGFDYQSPSLLEIESDDSSSPERHHNHISDPKADGDFEGSTRTDHNKGAEDAAAWAIQRSLDQMMERESDGFIPDQE